MFGGNIKRRRDLFFSLVNLDDLNGRFGWSREKWMQAFQLNGLLAHIRPLSFDTSSFASMNRASSSALLMVSTSSFARINLQARC
jgi:hypothetical protein